MATNPFDHPPPAHLLDELARQQQRPNAALKRFWEERGVHAEAYEPIPTPAGEKLTGMVQNNVQELLAMRNSGLEEYIRSFLLSSDIPAKDLCLCEQRTTEGATIVTRYWLEPRKAAAPDRNADAWEVVRRRGCYVVPASNGMFHLRDKDGRDPEFTCGLSGNNGKLWADPIQAILQYDRWEKEHGR